MMGSGSDSARISWYSSIVVVFMLSKVILDARKCAFFAMKYWPCGLFVVTNTSVVFPGVKSKQQDICFKWLGVESI